MRIVGAKEIADDPKLLKKTLDWFGMFESSTTPTSIIFPWLPTPAVCRRYYASVRLAMVFKNVISDRKKTGRREDDPLQYLLDCGDDLTPIMHVCFLASFDLCLSSIKI